MWPNLLFHVSIHARGNAQRVLSSRESTTREVRLNLGLKWGLQLRLLELLLLDLWGLLLGLLNLSGLLLLNLGLSGLLHRGDNHWRGNDSWSGLLSLLGLLRSCDWSCGLGRLGHSSRDSRGNRRWWLESGDGRGGYCSDCDGLNGFGLLNDWGGNWLWSGNRLDSWDRDGERCALKSGSEGVNAGSGL